MLKSQTLKVNNITCQKGYRQLFKNLSFTLESTDILHVTGVNGSGKTSLIRILSGIASIENGNIALDNYKIGTPEYRQQTLYLGHLGALNHNLSVLENLTFLTNLKQPVAKISLIEAINKVGLKNYQHELCAQLSAGQKRRVILAMLFVSTATLWLLDEPFTALDDSGIQIIEELILNHSKNGGMCIITTHQKSLLPRNKVLAL